MNRCSICGDAVTSCARFAPEPFVECRSCGFAFRPDLDAAALKRVYAEGGYEDIRGEHYLSEIEDRRRDARVRLRYIEPWVREGRLLDVGAAGGAFVAEANARGFDASGIEPVPSFARLAREQLGVNVRDGSLQDVQLEQASYQAITLWHVLEHVPNPLAELDRLAQALAGGGILAVEVPNAISAVAVHMGSSWPSLEPTVHVNQFTPTSLGVGLERAGFVLRDIRTTTITPYLRMRARFGPGHLAGRLKAAVWLRDPRPNHPSGHELLRAIAQQS